MLCEKPSSLIEPMHTASQFDQYPVHFHRQITFSTASRSEFEHIKNQEQQANKRTRDFQATLLVWSYIWQVGNSSKFPTNSWRVFEPVPIKAAFIPIMSHHLYVFFDSAHCCAWYHEFVASDRSFGVLLHGSSSFVWLGARGQHRRRQGRRVPRHTTHTVGARVHRGTRSCGGGRREGPARAVPRRRRLPSHFRQGERGSWARCRRCAPSPAPPTPLGSGSACWTPPRALRPLALSTQPPGPPAPAVAAQGSVEGGSGWLLWGSCMC